MTQPNQTPLPDREELREALHHLAVVSRGYGFDDGVARERDVMIESRSVDHLVTNVMQLIQAHDKTLLSQLREGAPKNYTLQTDLLWDSQDATDGFHEAKRRYSALFDKLESGL